MDAQDEVTTLRAELADALARLAAAEVELARYSHTKAASVKRSQRWQAKHVEELAAYRRERNARIRAERQAEVGC